MRREKIFANHKSVKGVICKIIRNSYKSIANQFKKNKTKTKPNNPITKWAKNWNSHFLK